MESGSAKSWKREERRAQAAAIVAEERKRQRRASLAIGSVVAVVVVVIGVLVATSISRSSSANDNSVTGPAPKSVLSDIASVPAAAFDNVGTGSSVASPKKVSGVALWDGDKPVVLYVGGEFCPYCAAERWAMAVALSRFGTFENMNITQSSGTDVDPNTKTLSFHGVKYSSKYLTFRPYEVEDRAQQPLDKITNSTDNAVWKKYGGNAFPFIYIGGGWQVNGPQYDPAVLKGMTQSQIARAIKDPSTEVGQDVLASANGLTRAICAETGGKPALVCQSTSVTG